MFYESILLFGVQLYFTLLMWEQVLFFGPVQWPSSNVVIFSLLNGWPVILIESHRLLRQGAIKMTGDHLTGLRACSAKVLPSEKLLFCLVRALQFLLIPALLYTYTIQKLTKWNLLTWFSPLKMHTAKRWPKLHIDNIQTSAGRELIKLPNRYPPCPQLPGTLHWERFKILLIALQWFFSRLIQYQVDDCGGAGFYIPAHI